MMNVSFCNARRITRDLRDLVAFFDEMRLPYALMGGLAVRVHGIPRPTYNIDFSVAERQKGTRNDS
jgi:hypothetical protein